MVGSRPILRGAPKRAWDVTVLELVKTKVSLVVVPGLLLTLALALAGAFVSDLVGRQLMGLARSPLSPVLMAILLGVLFRNLVGLPVWAEAGVRFGRAWILRFGIVLLGLRLGLGQVGAIGVTALPVIAGCVVTALVVISWFGRRMGISTRLGTLIAAGTSICGTTAIVALSPSLRASEDETAYAVACVTVFGMVAMLGYPFLAHVLFDGDALRAGIFMGTAVHDTAQVVGSGLVYEDYFADATALESAMVTKLVRNLGMLAVVPLLCVLYHRNATGEVGEHRPWYRMIPLFVLGFAAMSVLRTLGDRGELAFGMLTPGQWTAFLAAMGTVSQICMGVAMAAVGLGTSLRGLRRIGARPLIVGLASALLVGGMSWALITLLV